MTTGPHMLNHPQPSSLAHIHLCVDHIHIQWLYTYPAVLLILHLNPYLSLHNDEKNCINVQETLLRPFSLGVSLTKLLR